MIDKIQSIDDEEFLQAIREILEQYSSEERIFFLTDEQREAIREGQ